MDAKARSEAVKIKMKELKANGVRLGAVPFGYKLTKELDCHGRRILVRDEEEQKIIERICVLYHSNERVAHIGQILESEGLLCKGKTWDRRIIFRILTKNGVNDPERRCKLVPSRKELRLASAGCTRDKAIASARAIELRDQGLTIQEIGKQLVKENILPKYINDWCLSSIRKLLYC